MPVDDVKHLCMFIESVSNVVSVASRNPVAAQVTANVPENCRRQGVPC
jgi:hypothetical protein